MNVEHIALTGGAVIEAFLASYFVTRDGKAIATALAVLFAIMAIRS